MASKLPQVRKLRCEHIATPALRIHDSAQVVDRSVLPAAGQWFVSIRDHSSSELLVNMIPLICSYGEVNDLLQPFRHLRDGKGLGSLFCLRGTDEPSTPDPAGRNLSEFQVIWSDTNP